MKTELMRWRVVTPFGAIHEVTPRSRFRFSHRQQADEVFFRKELSAPLVFGGKGYGTDYELFKSLDVMTPGATSPNLRYEKSTITFDVKLSDGEWHTYWIGEFSGNDCEFDEDNCVVEVRPRVKDEYTCLLDNKDKEINMISLAPEVTTTATRFAPYEFLTVRPMGSPAPAGQGWGVFFNNNVDDDLTIYWREVRVIPCIGGVATPPSGVGWVLIQNNCSTLGTAKYARPVGSPPAGYVVQQGYLLNGLPQPPPAPVTYTLPALADAPSVVPLEIEVIDPMYRYMLPSSYPAKFKARVKNPRRPDGDYTWSVFGTGMTIIDGQGTAEITLQQAGAMPYIFTVWCEETTPCGNNTAVKTVTRLPWPLPAAPDSNMISPTTIWPGGEFEVRLRHTHGIPGEPGYLPTEWNVLNGVIISSSHDRCVVKAQGGIGVTCRVRYRWDGGLPDMPWSNYRDTLVTNALTTDPIEGPTSFCAPTQAEFFVPKRSGSTYYWAVPSGCNILENDGDRIVVDIPIGTVGDIEVREVGPVEPQWLFVGQPGGGYDLPWYWQLATDAEVEYTHGRLLSDVVTALVANCCSPAPIVSSDLMQWNPINVRGDDYVVAGLEVQLKFLTIHSKGDVLLPAASEPTRKLSITFAEIMEILKVVFDVWWFIDPDTGNLRLEHISWFEDRPAIALDKTGMPAKYSYRKSELPRMETFEWSEAETGDFIGFPIVYDLYAASPPRQKNPGVSERKLSHSAGNLSTDLPHIQFADVDEFDRQGFVIMHNQVTFDGSGTPILRVVEWPGDLTGSYMPNAYLSWACLHNRYHRHRRPVPFGYMNNQYTAFTSILPMKEETVSVKMCADDLFTFDPMKAYGTRVGDEGEVSDADVDFHEELLTLKLIHRPT